MIQQTVADLQSHSQLHCVEACGGSVLTALQTSTRWQAGPRVKQVRLAPGTPCPPHVSLLTDRAMGKVPSDMCMLRACLPSGQQTLGHSEPTAPGPGHLGRLLRCSWWLPYIRAMGYALQYSDVPPYSLWPRDTGKASAMCRCLGATGIASGKCRCPRYVLRSNHRGAIYCMFRDKVCTCKNKGPAFLQFFGGWRHGQVWWTRAGLRLSRLAH